MNSSKKVVLDILKVADIRINGKNKGDIIIKNQNFYKRVVNGGTLALGESYMDGWWECEDLDIFFYKLQNRKIMEKFLDDKKIISLVSFGNLKYLFHYGKSLLLNQQNTKSSSKSIRKHYDIGNDLYSLMLDETMTYSCAYWEGAKSLKEAQEAKFDLICKKLQLKKGMSVLDIGCGFGSFAKFASKNYGVKVLGITLSKEQYEYGIKNCKELDVKIQLKDYRLLTQKFDRIVSIGMFEHVGSKNYREYMEVVNRCLKDGGLTLLHTIGRNSSSRIVEPWISKYIFSNGQLPSMRQISLAMENIFIFEDVHSFGWNYDKTLMQWHKNFEKNWSKLKSRYDQRFYRMWRYYLLMCAGSFRGRNIQLWQIVMSKKGDILKYKSIR